MADHSTRRALNTPLLIASVVIATVVGGIALAAHQYFASQIAATFLQRATTLEKAKDWNAASAYLGRYLQLEPADLDARMRLLTAVENSATSAPAHNRLTSLLYQMVGSLPERTDLRVKLVEQLSATGRYKAAAESAQELLELGDESQAKVARRAIALSNLALAHDNQGVTFQEAAASLEQALEGDPSDIFVATLTAQLYRDKREEVGPTASAERADKIMDRLVELKPKDVDTLLARYNYRSRYQLKNAQADLDAALILAPERVDVLLLSADSDLRSGDSTRRETAEGTLRKIIEIAPLDPRAYVGLATYLMQTAQRDQAIEMLMQGRERLVEKSPDIDYLLAACLIESGQLDQARSVAADFSQQIEKLLSRVPTSSRIKLENMRRSLDAKLAFAAKDYTRAAQESEAIIVAGEKAGDVVDSVELLDAYAMLATTMSLANRTDQAAGYWAALAERSPGHRDAAWKAGLSYLATGRVDDALSQLENYAQLPNPSPEVHLALVQARLQEQLGRPATMRDWTSFNSALKQAQEKLPNRWELQAAQVTYLAVLNTAASRSEALDLLQSLEAAHANKPEVVERLIVFYRQFGQSADAQRVLDQYRKSPGNEIRAAILQAGLLVGDKRSDEAVQLIDALLEKTSAGDSRDLELARVKILLAAGKVEPAQQALAALIERDSKDRQLLAFGIEIALMRQDFAAAEKWEGLLKENSIVDDVDWRYFRARRLISQYAKLDQSQRDELEQLVDSVQTQRPAWAPMMTLAGQFAELRGDKEGAIDAYRSALVAGDRRAETMQLLARALYAAGRFDEAKQMLSRFGANEAMKGQLESMAIVAAVQDNRLAEARSLAQQAVDSESKDPLHYIWLANLHFEADDQAAAEQTFRKALERFPRDARVWNGVFMFFVQSKQLDKARLALDRWTERVPLTEAQKELVLGDGKQMLGDRAAAEAHYQKAIAADDRNVPARVRLAKLLMDSNVSAAREQLDAVLRIEPNHTEAQQYLAAVLAASGNDADWTQAVQLLERGGSAQNAAAMGANDRLHAILLARKGKNEDERRKNYQAAEEMLVKRLEQPDATGAAFDVDRMLLAGIFEQQSRLNEDPSRIESAREVLRPLVERDDATAEHLLFYIQLLMRHLAEVADKSPDSEPGQLQEEFASDIRNRTNELEQRLADEPQSDRKALPIALRVKLLSIEGQNEAGKQLIEEYAERELANVTEDSDRAKVYLRAGGLCQSAKFDADAEKWFRKLVEITPNGYVLVAQSLLKQGKSADAIDFCLDAGRKMPAASVATVLAQILSSEEFDAASDRKAQPLITAALDEDRGNVDLLMSVAVQRVTRDQIDDAARLFKRVIELQPRHTLALNNLATLYAEQPEHLEEAQQYIERAMAVAGRNPALLDTLGTILLRAGKFDEAVAALEESVAGSANDPRYYFHLAAAYEGANQPAKAKKALDAAINLGLDRAILTEGDRELLAALKQQLLAVNDQN